MTSTAGYFTAITFAPVQGFIEKSRKLRDLYGSSFILSYLSRALCDAAKNHYPPLCVISPALINLTQGTPNQIIIEGDFPEATSRKVFDYAWETIVDACREVIEELLPESELSGKYNWRRAWNNWASHGWEFFWAQSSPNGTITEARHKLNEKKRSRAWTGINWNGESSTLSGSDGIAWYGMTDRMHPTTESIAIQSKQIAYFYQKLSKKLSESILDETERLSIPELIKRVLLLDRVVDRLNKLSELKKIPKIESPGTFAELNRYEAGGWTGWFQGDGDGIGNFLKSLSQSKGESKALQDFSKAMMDWGAQLPDYLPQNHGKIIYAGGDDFFGVLYHVQNPPLSGRDCLVWLLNFPEIWEKHGQKDAQQKLLTVSVGFVWAAPNVPQRDVLQHCREAEKSAKNNGRDRLAIRILFNGGNYLEWVCPWWFLRVLADYTDRDGIKGENANWGHFFEDVATLQARHALGRESEIGLKLFAIYFGEENYRTLVSHLWDTRDKSSDKTGILANKPYPDREIFAVLNDWIINLANVGFHLHRSPLVKTPAKPVLKAA